MIIYHNPRCRKSREGIAYLDEKSKTYQVREYLKDPLSKNELQVLVDRLGIKPSELLRKGEKIYKDQYKGKDIQEEQWIEIMLEHPQLIERPIIDNGKRAVIGRPKEEIDKVF